MAVSFWGAAGVLGLGDFAYKAVAARHRTRAGRSLMFIGAFVSVVNMDENKFLVGIIPELVQAAFGCVTRGQRVPTLLFFKILLIKDVIS